jgi:hypothetical protein
MWKCKTCDKVNEDKLEICWGCYAPKRNNYIEVLEEKVGKPKAPEYYKILLILNIPVILVFVTAMCMGIYFWDYMDFSIPVFLLLIFSFIFIFYLVNLYHRKKASIYLGFFIHLIIVVTHSFLIFFTNRLCNIFSVNSQASTIIFV